MAKILAGLEATTLSFWLELSVWARTASKPILGGARLLLSSALLCLRGSSAPAAQVTNCRRASDPLFRHES